MNDAHRERLPNSVWWILAGVCCVAAVVAVILIRVLSEPSRAQKEAVAIGISAAQLPGASTELSEPVAAEEPEVEAAAPAPNAATPGLSQPAQVQRGRATVDIVKIESALENYAINNSMRYPDTLEVLVTPDVNGETYLRATALPKDPWGNDYLYEPPEQGQPQPRILCLGADGREGGVGEDADLDNVTIRGDSPKY